jgi:pimeloyl-ACP methyl ester carboxylesterase
MIRAVENGKFHELAMQLSDTFILQQRIKKNLQEMFLRSGASRLINDQTAMIQRSESFSILPNIKIPTLLIHARQDQVFSLAENGEMASLIPNAQLALIEDSGHMSPMEQPQAITTLMRLWLTYF